MNIKNIKKIEGGKFSTNKKGWVVFDLRKNGIICTIQKSPVEGKFCSKISEWGEVSIPAQIENKYNLYGNCPTKEISYNAFVLEARCNGLIPKFPKNVSYINNAVEGKIKYETTMEVIGTNALTMNRAGQRLVDLNAIIRVHLGDYNCLEIVPNQSCGYSLSDLRDIYGNYMNRFCGNYVEYDNPNKSDYQLPLPSFFTSRCGIKHGEDVRVVVLEDGRVLITPIPKADEMTGERILPESEKSEEITLCENCDESEVLKLLITELKTMQELVANQAKTNELLRVELESCLEENNTLRNDINNLHKLLRKYL